jgi:hypothetical protein
VALFAAEHTLDSSVILMRALSTIGGAALAVVGEFALLPTWDKKWLPRHIAAMIDANYNYFLFTFYPNRFSSAHQWTHFRRMAESSNSNAFDSFNRYLAEPTSKTKDYTLHYQIISHCIRITRELNNYHIETDLTKTILSKKEFEIHKLKIHACLLQFNYIEEELNSLNISKDGAIEEDVLEEFSISFIPLNDIQSTYLDKLNVELNAFVRDMNKWVAKAKEHKIND